jgi:hypothetical protein
VLDPLRLLPGTYDLTAVVADRTLLHEYDHLQNIVRFDVERGPIHEDWGVVSLHPRWRIGDLEGET